MNMNIIKTFILIVLPVIGYSQTLTRLNLAQLAQSGATDGQYIKWDNASSNWVPATVTSSGGTVTSVGLSLPNIFTVTVSPITSSGTLTATLANQNANVVFAGPSEGTATTPTFRSLVAADIPALPYVPTTRTLTINGTALDLSANRSWSVGTVTQLSAAIGTTGTDIGYTISNATTTPLLTINIPTASSSVRGALSSADWSTFNNKQSAITLTTTNNSGAATFTSNTLNIPNYTLAGLGGFANPMTTLGDIIYGGTSGTATRLAGNTTATPRYLYQLGNGTISSAPSWKQIAGDDITGAALTKTNDTNVTLSLDGFTSTSLLRPVSLTLGWTGQLAVSRGGTGLSTLGTANQYLRVNSGATALEYATLPTVITDHGALTGLGDDDHTQYAILGGRGSGQTLRGGTSGSATLQLSSTSNATKGRVEIAYDGGDVWIGGASTASTLRLYGPSGTYYTGLTAGSQAADLTYTLPITGGTSGQFLSTNGSGTLSWATGATISGTTGRLAYFDSGTSITSTGVIWNNTNSTLSINNPSPSATLQVAGTSDNSGTYSLYITNQSADKILNFDNSGKVGINVSSPATTLHFNGSMSRKAPVKTGVSSTYTVAETDSWIMFTANANATVTLPTASNFQGREIMVKNVGAYSVVSASSNVIAINASLQTSTPTTTTSILPATAGKWATLVSAEDLAGNWYWAIMQAN